MIDAENPGIARAPEDYLKISRYHFRVDEAFSAISERELDLYSTRGGADCSAHFTVGKQYLVFAYKSGDGRISTDICTSTREVRQAQAFLPQLRARRAGHEVASLFGVLRRVEQPYQSVATKAYDQPLGNVLIRLTAGDRSFETRTDLDGTYLFYDLPEGKYRISGELPPGLEIGQTILSDPPPSLTIPAKACLEHDIEALPTGRIRGRVLDSQGKPLQYASVALFRADLYATFASRNSLPWTESQDEKRPFEFLHVAPGEYLLVFNYRDDLNPDSPYPRTFFPDARELENAKRVTVAEGQEILAADIHLKDPFPTRQITIRVIQEDGTPDVESSVEVRASRGRPPFPRKVAPGVFTLSLFPGTNYIIHAWDSCRIARKVIRSDPAEIADSDEQKREITLIFPRKSCGRRNEQD